MTDQQYRWSTKDLDELVEFYLDEIRHDFRRDGYDPEAEHPSYQWLVDAGYSGIAYALREQHRLTLRQFFETHVPIGPDGDDDAEDSDAWAAFVDDDRTREALVGYVGDVQYRLAESTAASRRSHLTRFVDTYDQLHGSTDLVSPLLEDAEFEPEKRRLRAVANALADDLSPRSVSKYLRDVELWYDQYLCQRFPVEHNPADGLADPHTPDASERDTKPALDGGQVRRLYEAADSQEDRLLVLALAGWGLRREEVARLHVSQLETPETDDDVAHLSFDDRKQGPSTVALIYGVDDLLERVDVLDERDQWNGYIFPSAQSESGHISKTTVWRRLKRLGETAGVTVDGDPPKPHQARRYWYRAYQDVMQPLFEAAGEAAQAQGSSDAGTVLEDYFDDPGVRRQLRQLMEQRIAEAFDTR